MPAYRERVYICPDKDGQPAWILAFPVWWDRAGFFQKFGDRQIDTGNPFYVDFGLLLTGWEASAWDKQCKEQFAQDPRHNELVLIEEMSRWDAVLSTASWVIVESYEWESGLS